MKKFFQYVRRQPPTLNMTSMIDVIFLLLIFFVCTSNFDKLEKLLPTNLFLPGREKSVIHQTTEQKLLGQIQIRILAENGSLAWTVNSRRCDSLDLVRQAIATLENISPEVPVTIDPTGDIPIENVLDVYDICRQSGLMKIQFAARPETAL